MECSTLPDTDLLQVLTYLTASELLQCRAVCRRWSELALHPSLWRSHNLTDDMLGAKDEKSGKCLTSALSVAPCARSIEVDFDYPAADVCFLALASTRCAASRLVLTCTASDSLPAAQVLSRQATLGRLKYVKLFVHSINEEKKRRAGALLHQLIHIEGLEVIDYYCEDVLLAPASASTVPVRASLRQLTTLCSNLHPYLRLLMQWHSATLEVVSIQWMNDPRVVPLLSSMPRLRKLECDVLEDMPALLQCPSLKSLEVHDGGESTQARLLGLQKLLRGAAARLENVFIELCGKGLEETADVVRSVGGTEAATAALRSLCIYEASLELLPTLSTLLGRLPHLTTLQVDCGPSDAFLQSLDGRVVHKLVELCFSPPGCPHELARSEQVRQLMRRYPLLHFFVQFKKCAECKYCEQHACRRSDRYSWILVSSHAKGVPCDVTHERSYYEISLP